ncbi:phosphatidate cytidylyltransferase [bacterium]|nr:phosphatidate cytidylyltransferase [bacterium]
MLQMSMQTKRRPNARSGSESRTAIYPIAESPSVEKNNRWSNYYTRCIWGIFMLLAFGAIILGGHVPVIILVVMIQTAIFKEVIGIAHQRYREKKLAWFRTINWFFLLSAYYYLFGDSFIEFFRSKFLSDRIFRTFSMRHRFVSFCLYLSGLILFVLNLKKGHYKFQFNQFGLAHMTILIVVFQSHLLIRNLFEGLYWFVFPVLLVVSNDIMAYFIGFFFGKTPLIKLSPKKTWEGFIGGFISTVLIGFIVGHVLSKFNYLICPASVNLFLRSFLIRVGSYTECFFFPLLSNQQCIRCSKLFNS